MVTIGVVRILSYGEHYPSYGNAQNPVQLFLKVLYSPIASHTYYYPEDGGSMVVDFESRVVLCTMYALAVLLIPQANKAVCALQMWYLRVEWRSVGSDIQQSDLTSWKSSCEFQDMPHYCLSARYSVETH